jgi:AcrR family transcriptional regulator
MNMVMNEPEPVAAADKAAASAAGQDQGKRQQILDGAKRVFLSRGFDGASMDEIARAAGVSKGTLYVYFENKEHLFASLIEQERTQQAETLFRLDHDDHDVGSVLTRLGIGFLNFMTVPGALSSFRVVIGIAERMPEIGEEFYQVGPSVGVAKLKAYLDAQVAVGALVIDDTQLAAFQFLDLCLTSVMKPLLFCVSIEISQERRRYVIGKAVEVFLASYGPERR